MWWFSAMSSNRNREEFGPVTRNRSSSANEASKPILVLQRRQTHTGNKPLNFSPSNASNDGKSFLDIFLCFYTFAFYGFINRKQIPNDTFFCCPLPSPNIWTYLQFHRESRSDKNRKESRKKKQENKQNHTKRNTHTLN